MSISGNIEGFAAALRDKAHGLNRLLSSEVYGGRWGDDVGRSYLPYTESLVRLAEELTGGADSLKRLEDGLKTVDETADKSRLNTLSSAVNRL